ncbi:uncharacterized protein [Ptychodera flava]|uniref:uncharacterized protein isoform X2 n=1 Tax=Ptychodera flava TaxID=63121 RepID=UPI00396A4370
MLHIAGRFARYIAKVNAESRFNFYVLLAVMADFGLHPLSLLYKELSDNLDREEEHKLRNLICGRQIAKRTIESLQTPQDIFKCLEECGIISEANLEFLRELLQSINRRPLIDLVDKCEKTLQEYTVHKTEGKVNGSRHYETYDSGLGKEVETVAADCDSAFKHDEGSTVADGKPARPGEVTYSHQLADQSGVDSDYELLQEKGTNECDSVLKPLTNDQRADDEVSDTVGTDERQDDGHADDVSEALDSLECQSQFTDAQEDSSIINDRPEHQDDITGSQFLDFRGTLLSAAEKGEVHSLDHLLKTGLGIDCFNEDGNTALILASKNGHSKCVEFLLKHKANVVHRNESSETCLHVAIQSGHAEIVEILLKLKGLKIVKDNEYQALLRLAVKGDHSEVLGILMESNSVTENQAKDCIQAFFMAAELGSCKCLSVMLWSAKIKNSAQNENGDTVLHVATRHGQSAAVKLLLHKGVDKNVINKGNQTALCLALDFPKDSKDKIKILFYLLQAGCYVTMNAKNALLNIENVAYVLHTTEAEDDVIDVDDEDDLLTLLGQVKYVSIMVFRNEDVLVRLREIDKSHEIDTLILGNMSLKLLDCKDEMFQISKSLCLINTQDIHPRMAKTWLSERAKVMSFIAMKLSFPIIIMFPGSLHAINISHCFSKSKQDRYIKIECQVAELYLNNNGLTKLQEDIGTVPNLTSLIASDNKIKKLPLSLARIDNVLVRDNPITNVHHEKFGNPRALKAYLQPFRDSREIPNKNVSVDVVGPENETKDALRKIFSDMVVGKGKNSVHLNVNQTTLPKHGTESADVDTESLEVRSLFFASNKLYVATFDLDKFTVSPNPPLWNTVDERGRLVRWLNAIQSRAPNSRVILVGTYDEKLKRRSAMQDSLDQVNDLIQTCYQKHREAVDWSECQYCCLCDPSQSASNIGNFSKDIAKTRQDQRKSSNVAANNIPMLPHIVGYCEIPRKLSYEKSKKHRDLVRLKKILSTNVLNLVSLRPTLPENWNSLKITLGREKTERPILSFTEFSQLAKDIGIEDNVSEVLEYLTAEGAVIKMDNPQHEGSKSSSIFCIYPPYLLSLFSLLYREVDEKGVLTVEQLHDIRQSENRDESQFNSAIKLFRKAELCVPRKRKASNTNGTSADEVGNTSDLIFIHKLSSRQPNSSQWPRRLKAREKTMSYLYSCGFAVYKLFNGIVMGAGQHRGTLHILRNNVIYEVKRSFQPCSLHTDPKPNEVHSLRHAFRIKVIPYISSIAVTVKGQYPCCALNEFDHMIQELAGKSECQGLELHFKQACPTCIFTSNPTPGFLNNSDTAYQCSKISEHTFYSWKDVLKPEFDDSHRSSYMPSKTNDVFEYPRLFIIPPSQSGFLKKRDSRLHFLCECPESYHLVDHPGYKLQNIHAFEETFEKYLESVKQFLERVSVDGEGSHDNSADTVQLQLAISKLSEVEKTITEGIGSLSRSRPRLTKFEFTHLFQSSADVCHFTNLHRVVQGDHQMYLCKEHASLFEKV